MSQDFRWLIGTIVVVSVQVSVLAFAGKTLGVFVVKGSTVMCRVIGGWCAPNAAAASTKPATSVQPVSASKSRTTAADAGAAELAVAGDKVLIGMPLAEVQALLETHEDYRVEKAGPDSLFVSRRRGLQDWVPLASISGRNGIVNTIISTYASEATRSAAKTAAGVYHATQELLQKQRSVSCVLASANTPDMEVSSVELTCGRYTLNILRGRVDAGDSASVSLTLR